MNQLHPKPQRPDSINQKEHKNEKTTNKVTQPKPIQEVSESENNQNSKELTGWQPYNLDHFAQELILNYRDQKDVLNETHKMRMTVAYGLERFWGEHLRLKRENQEKSKYWKAVWDKLAKILTTAGVNLPNDYVNDNTEKIREMANKIWAMSMNDQRIALMVLTQFCDSLVWWCQRYKKPKDS